MDPAFATVLAKHIADRFPSECRGKAIHGIELVLLDADVTTIASCAIFDRESEDIDVSILGRSVLDCNIILPWLHEYAHQYFRDVLFVAEGLLDFYDADYLESYHRSKALLQSISLKQSNSIKAHLGIDIDINKCIYGYDSPLILASRMDYVEGVSILLEHGADIDISNGRGVTPVLAATFYGAPHSLDYLLKRGARVDTLDIDGTSALWWAIASKNIEIVKLLLAYGAQFIEDEHLEESWQRAEHYFDLANVYRELGRHTDAIQAYQQACALAPQEAAYLMALGDEYHSMQRADEAKGAWERASAIQSEKASNSPGNVD